MFNGIEDFAYVNEDGSLVMPSGPCSIWPQERGQLSPEILKKIADGRINAKFTQEAKLEPGLAEMAKGAAGSLFDLAVSGVASKELQEERYQACTRCPFFIKKTKQCSKCGCVMPFKVKVKDAVCPVGIW